MDRKPKSVTCQRRKRGILFLESRVGGVLTMPGLMAEYEASTGTGAKEVGDRCKVDGSPRNGAPSDRRPAPRVFDLAGDDQADDA